MPKLTKHQQDLWRWGSRDWPAKLEREAARHPIAPLAQKLYRLGQPLLRDSERGSISPLGGQARSMKEQNK